jgi:predicted ATP-dependent endonuclease of OLD family|nr:MAG TPA: STRUCTURAL MAINTENANCE OF CHROMOSOMES PROTEIN [Bacteriophage sp.]
MIKITNLELENIKRIKAVQLAPSESGLTVIGGNNGQGKTSVLDAIAWALGGDKFKPSQPQRDGSVIPPHLRVTLSNGLIVERRGDKSALKITDPNGGKGGQQLLNEFISQLALDLPKFMQATSKEKAQTLLRIIGVGDKLAALEQQEQTAYNQRRAVGQTADQKQKYADELPSYPDVPAEEISISELIRQQQDILARNGENQRLRNNRDICEQELLRAQQAFDLAAEVLAKAQQDAETARKSAEDIQDESTAEIEENIRNIDILNAKVRANRERDRAVAQAQESREQYGELTAKIEDIRAQKTALLDGADLPLPGLSVEDGELTYNGAKWDCMSGAEQLRVSTAIVRRLNPQCGFVLMDKLEQMDAATLAEFGAWLEQEGLQVIATRVSTGGECSVIIEDGYAKPAEQPAITSAPQQRTSWSKGVF